MPSEEYPPIEPGGSLILAWQAKNKRILLVGGGNVAASRIYHLLNADALITLICPTAGLAPETIHRLKTHASSITHIDRDFQPSDLDDESISLVLTAIDDPIASTDIYKLAKKKRLPVNIADVPPECDFYFGSVHRDGPLQIMVSTNGNGPRMAAMVRRSIAESLPDNMGAAITKVGELRRRLRVQAPGNGNKIIQKRMDWMSEVCDKWSVDDFVKMTEKDMVLLLRGFDDDLVLPKSMVDELLSFAKKFEEQIGITESDDGEDEEDND